MSDVDLVLGTVSITKSRDEQHEAAPKTEGSVREIKLLPNVLEVLRAMPKLLHADEDTYFFRNPNGGPITTTWWPKKSWYPVLRVLEIRPRKFYATRHSFISVALSKGCNLNWVAEYCGTSIEMIEKSLREVHRRRRSGTADPLAAGGENAYPRAYPRCERR